MGRFILIWFVTTFCAFSFTFYWSKEEKKVFSKWSIRVIITALVVLLLMIGEIFLERNL